MKENELTYTIIGSALQVHKALGPGLLESSYMECLTYELKLEGLKIETQKAVPIIYKEVHPDL